MRTLRTSAVAAIGAALALTPIAPVAAAFADTAPGQEKDGHHDFVVIGDIPYGPAQIAAFPGWVDRINAEPSVELAVHVGDTKNGSSPCTDEYNAWIKGQFDRFTAPLLYTPGDNEWTDCHRPAAGRYNPLERLGAIRGTFFADPTKSLGSKPVNVSSHAAQGFPENQSLHDQGIAFATLHVVGSNNDRAPWTGIGLTAPTVEQLAEEQARMADAIAQVRETFATARQRHDRAVVLFQQADMFDPGYQPGWDVSAFQPLVQALIDESGTFDGEVYLFDGDSHVYNVDRPVASGSRWLDIHGVTGFADNLTRVTVDGEANNANGFLKVTVNRPGAEHVLSWERLPY